MQRYRRRKGYVLRLGDAKASLHSQKPRELLGGLSALADGRTDGRPSASSVPAGAAGASRDIWQHSAVADDSEVIGASRGCWSSHRARGAGRGSPSSAWGFLQSEKKGKTKKGGSFATQIITLKADGAGFMRTRCRRRAGSSCRESRHGGLGSRGGTALALLPGPQMQKRRRRKGLTSSSWLCRVWRS